MPDTPEVQTDKPDETKKTFNEAYVKELRGEAKANRLRVEALTAELQGFKDKDKSELEKITERAATAERALADKDKEIAQAQMRHNITSLASRMNIVDPDAAFKLLDLSQVEDDPKSAKKALESLVKEKPFLLKPSGPPTPGAGGPPVKGKKSPDDMFVDMLKSGIRK